MEVNSRIGALQRKDLTKESATELCRNDFWSAFIYRLYDANHLHYQCALQIYLKLLGDILPLVPRSTFLRLLTDECPGCASLTLLCILYIHPILENEVYHLFRQLLNDVNGDILTRRDICQLAVRIQKEYKLTEVPFPHWPNCLNFNQDSEALQKTLVVSKLFSSDRFCALMKKDPIIGARLAHEIFKDLGDRFHQPDELNALLTKYSTIARSLGTCKNLGKAEPFSTKFLPEIELEKR